jgi:hypothetical protein
MATASSTTAIPKKVDVSTNDGKTFGEKVFFLELWSIGNTASQKTIEIKGEESRNGPFRQIQFRFDKDRNYVYTKSDVNQKGFDETYAGTASEYSISGLSAGSAKTVIRMGRTNNANDVAEQYNGPAERVEVKVEQPQIPPEGGGQGPKVSVQGMALTPQFVTPTQEAPGVLFDLSFQQDQPITLPDGTKFTPTKRVNTASEYGQMWRGYRSGGDDGSFELNIETGKGSSSYLVEGYYSLPSGLTDHKKGKEGEVTNIINDGHFKGDSKHQYKLETIYHEGGTLTGEAVFGTEDDHGADTKVKPSKGAKQVPESKAVLKSYTPGDVQLFKYVVKKVKGRNAQRIKYWVKDKKSGEWIKVFDHVDLHGANGNIADYLNHSNPADAVRIDGCTKQREEGEAKKLFKGIEESPRAKYNSLNKDQKSYLESIADADIRTVIGDDEDDPANWTNDKPYSTSDS